MNVTVMDAKQGEREVIMFLTAMHMEGLATNRRMVLTLDKQQTHQNVALTSELWVIPMSFLLLQASSPAAANNDDHAIVISIRVDIF
jgi:hypothetical protein